MFCSKCGKELQSDQKFCSNCGAMLGNQQETMVKDQIHVRKYKCPKCKSYHVRVYDQATGSVGNMTQMNSSTSVGYSVASYRTMWRCEDCGFSFQDPNWQRKHLKEGQMVLNFFFFCLSCGVCVFGGIILGSLGVLLGVLFGIFSIYASASHTKRKLLEVDEFEKTILTKQL